MRYAAYILMLISINTAAQVGGNWIESGQLKLRVNADGQLATFNNSAASELTPGSNNHLFKFINIWISGYDDSNKLHITSVNGFNNKSDYSPGPIDKLTYISAEPDSWNYVWPITAYEIKEHRKNFKNSNYMVNPAIKNWPSNGPKDYYQYLAPFIDYDEDGKYMPENGDYPDIIGDKACYFIVNDNHHEHKASGGQPLIIEMYGMAYSLADAPNTVFTKYYIINRTNKNFKDIQVSFHAGFQLGNDKDNYCGTIVPKNMIFSYNGDADDDGHFGTTKPLASLMILNKNISSTLYITKDTGAFTGMPVTDFQHRNMMEGRWKSGKQLTYSGDGTMNTNNCNYVYSGTTDPNAIGQNWVENSTPGERSMLTNMSYPALSAKGGYVELDIAVTGFDKSDENPYIFMDKKASDIKNVWLKKNNSGKQIETTEYRIKNPVASEENFYQDWFNNFDQITIYNHLGQIIKQIETKVDNALILNQKGIYYISLKSENQIITKKILIF